MTINACPGCGATWSCGGGCPIWGYRGTGWKRSPQEIEAMDKARLKQLATETLNFQDACNLSGVAQAFSRMVLEIRQMFGLGTDETNTHPIVICWLDKMNQLAGIQVMANDEYTDKVYKAFRQVQDWAGR